MQPRPASNKMNYNKAIIVGRVTQNPEVRTTPNGQQVTSFSVATNRYWTDKSGQKQDKAEFHNIVAWGRTAEIAGQYLQKGAYVLIEGRIETRSWDDVKSGQKRYRTEIIVENLQLGPRGGDAPVGNNQGSQPEKNEESSGEVPTVDSNEEINVKDIPF